MISLSLCLCVCSRIASISLEPLVQTSPNFLCILSMALARSLSGGIAIRYVLPVLWMTSYFSIMGPTCIWRRRCKKGLQAQSLTSGSTDLTPRRTLKLTYQGAAPDVEGTLMFTTALIPTTLAPEVVQSPPSVCPSVCIHSLHPLFVYLNRPTYDLDLLHVSRS